MVSVNWNYPTAVRFGPGRIKELPEACKSLGVKKPFLVTDPGLAKLPMIASALAALKTAGVPATLFASIKPNPVESNIADGLAAYRAGKHDGVVAFGGGSALDAGKAIAFMAGQTRPLFDFEDIGDYWTRADEAGIAPSVAVPTTAGTGSEVGRTSVIIDETHRKKRLIFHPKVQPRIVIEDPELTVGLPAHITAATGMDALAHCLEAYCVDWYHPMADGIALEGMRLVQHYLPVAVREPQNIEARGHMMVAATMGATAFQKGLGAVHSLSHPLGVFYDQHHGLLNSVMMPYVLAFNRSAIEAKMLRLARFLDLKTHSTDGVIAWVLELRRTIGLPHTLRELNIDDKRIDEVARDAVVDPTAPTNPIKLTLEGARQLMLDALAGNVR